MGMQGPEPRSGAVLPTELHSTLTGHEGPVLAVRFNRSGAYCLTCGKDRTFRLWNPYKGLLVKTYTGHAHEVRDVACAADNSRLATGGGDKQVFLWDVASGQKIRRFRGHESAVNAVQFAGEGDSVVVSAGYDRAVKMWDVRSNSIDPIQSVVAWKDSVTSLVVTEHRITAGSVDGTVRTLDVRAGRMLSDTLGHPVLCVRQSHDGQCLLAGMLGSRLALIDRASGEVLAEYKGHSNEVAKVDSCLTYGDAHVVSGSEDGQVYFWELIESTVEAKVDAHPGAVVCGLDYHPKKEMMVTSSTDGTAKLWVPSGGRAFE